MRINKLKIVKNKLLPLALAGGITLSLSGCNGRVDMSSISFEDLLAIEEVSNVSLMDDAVDAGLFNFTDDKSYVEAADDLLRYLDIIDQLANIDFSEVKQLSKLDDDQYLETINYSLDDVKELKELLHSKDKSLVAQENKINAYKKLDFLNNYCKDFVHNNGKDISLSMMMKAVKTSIAAELGLSVNDISDVVIPPNESGVNDEPHYEIIVGDKEYTIKLSFNEMCNTIDYIYSVQRASLNDKTEYETYRKALNYAKTTIDRYIEKNIIKK